MKVSQLLLNIFAKDCNPLSETELRFRLKKIGTIVNKTTVYRALDTLKSQKVIRDVDFGDSKKRYELNSRHHHHLVCTDCKTVAEIEFEPNFASVERMVKKQKKFKVINHSLEFFGLCSNCSK